jgi:hypothetical protein
VTGAAKPKPHMRRRSEPTVAHIDVSRLADGVLVMNINDVLTKNERHRLIKIGPRAAIKESDLAVQFKAALRSRARVFAAGPSGCKLQRAALAWLKRKCQACGRAASSQSSEHDASLARKAAAL